MNRPTIHELECFVAAAEELNFTKAARRLHMSQPPLSRQIQSLEAKLEAPLLTRSTRAVVLTTAGQLFLEDARSLLTRLDGAANTVRRARGGETARLRLAFVGALLDEGLVRVLQRFRREHPRCQVHLSDLPPAEQFEALVQGSLDAGFIGAPPKKIRADLQTFLWKREPLFLALPESHPLASRTSALRLRQLGNEGWIMVSREAAPAFRQQFDRLCAAAGFKPRVVQESDRVPAVLTMVAAGEGVSLLPKAVAKLISEGVVFHPVAGRGATLDHTFLYQRKGRSLEMDAFIALLRRAGHRR